MTSIKFLYGASNRLQASAAWLAKSFQKHAPIVVYIPDDKQGNALDQLLWAQVATGFVPHCHADSSLAANTPIVLTQVLNDLPHDNCLLNLSDDVPMHFSRFQHLVEIVSGDEQEKLAGRERFRFYRDRGYPLESLDISTGISP